MNARIRPSGAAMTDQAAPERVGEPVLCPGWVTPSRGTAIGSERPRQALPTRRYVEPLNRVASPMTLFIG
jgi:hypothetical protein